LSRLVRIPALHAGGHGFKSHPLHCIHGFIHNAFMIKPKVLSVALRMTIEEYKKFQYYGNFIDNGIDSNKTILTIQKPILDQIIWKMFL
jgi:hypothetical protein